MNGIMRDVGRSVHRLVATRYTFRRVFMAGLCAMLRDAVGFAVLLVIRIPVIQALVVIASLGVAILMLTNLALLPILLCGCASPRSVRSCNGLSLNDTAWALAPRAELHLTVPVADAILVPTK
jgi:predicted RND superfamily exporter protein